MRANVEASRGSITATATSVSWAMIHTVNSMRIRPCQKRDPQEHGEEDDEAGRDRGFARRSVDGVVLRPQLEQLVEEAEVDAQVGQHAPRDERRAREDRLVVGGEDRREEDGEQAGEAQHDAVEQQPVARVELVFERLPQIDAREAVGGQLGDVGDRLPGLDA